MARFDPALVKVDSTVIVIAGQDVTVPHNPLSAVSCFNMAKNTWSGKLPPLIQARGSPSACYLDAYIFVFCGWDGGKILNSIEKIHQSHLKPKCQTNWQLIDFPINNFPAREVPAVAPLNNTEIVILGGYIGNKKYSSSVVLFDTTTSQCRQVVRRGYDFASWSNQCV